MSDLSTRSQPRGSRRLVTGLAIVFLALSMVVVCVVGPWLVRQGYEQRSLEIVNSVFASRDAFSLDHYVNNYWRVIGNVMAVLSLTVALVATTWAHRNRLPCWCAFALGRASFSRECVGGLVFFHATLLLVVFATVGHWLMGVFTLDGWHEDLGPTVLFAAYEQGSALPVLAIILLVAGFMFRRTSWSAMPGPSGIRRRFRIGLVAVCVIICTSYALLPFNFYHEQAYVLDRVLLILFASLAYYNVAFVGISFIYLLLYTSQFLVPANYSLTDVILVHDAMLVLWIGLIMVGMRWVRTYRSIIVALLCVVAAHYIVPGWGKWKLGWVLTNDLSMIARAAWYQNGWLESLGPEMRGNIWSLVEQTQIVMMWGTLICEIGVVVFFLKRKFSQLLLLSLMGMHFGIFFSTGIFFWKWIVVVLFAVFLLGALSRRRARQIFGVEYVAFGAVMIICLASVITTPRVLAWYDAPMFFHFHIEAVGEAGSVYQIPASDFAPFDKPFAQGRFFFLTDRPQTVGAYGGVFDRKLLDQLRLAQRIEDFHYIGETYGVVRFDAKTRDRLGDLLRRRFNSPTEHWLNRIVHGPQHIWSEPRYDLPGKRYHYQEPIVAVRVILHEAAWLSGEFQPISRTEVLRIDITNVSDSASNH